jgi:Spy/CpxP family protein refolding chaperone
MARQFGWGLAAALLVIGSIDIPAAAQSEQTQTQPPKTEHERRQGDRPPPWWKNPKHIAELGLTTQQSAKIDEIFHKTMETARPLREEVQKLEKNLDATIREAKMEVSAFAQEVEKIESKRAELNKMRTVMLYRMRRVLNSEQNAKLQVIFDRWEAERRKQDDRRR